MGNQEENYYEEALIVVFQPQEKSNELIPMCVSMGRIDDVECKIDSGYFEGFSTTDFNRMIFLDVHNPFEVEDDYYDVSPTRVEFMNHYTDKNEVICVINEDCIWEYSQENGISYEDACIEMARHILNQKLVFENDYFDLNKNMIHYYKVYPHRSEVDENTIMSMLDMVEDKPEDLEKDKKEKESKVTDETKDENEETTKLDPVEQGTDYSELAMRTISEIREKIVGQDAAIVTLVTNILYNQKLIDEVCKDYYYDQVEFESRKIGILLDGSTGTGKSAILKMIASKLDIPIVIANVNNFSETGYVGASVTDLLRKLYIISGRRLDRAEIGIIVLDEVDKICQKSSGEGKDMKKGVQQELLGFISGGEYDFPLDEQRPSEMIHFNTLRITFILSGAFTHLRERKIKEKEKGTGMGFVSQVGNNGDRTYTLEPKDYVEEGMDLEFFGRARVLAYTNTYSKEDLKHILLHSSISPLKNIEKTVQMFGYIGITYDDEFIDEVCEQAYKMNTGARALQTIMAGIQDRILLELFNHTFDFYEPIRLSVDLLKEYNMSLVRKY